MFKKINSFYERIPWRSLRDPKNVGLIIFLVIVLLISWSGVKALQTNYNLQKQISLLKQQNDFDQLQNINQQLQNEYYGTNQYLNVTSREEFGLGEPGETELIVPRAVAFAHLAPITVATTSLKTSTNQTSFEKNFQAWVDFILHKQNTN